MPYTLEEIKSILYTRAKIESIDADEEAFNLLASIGVQGSLRYAIQLLTPASVLCKINGREIICPEDIEEVNTLFLDAKSSAQVIQQSTGFIL